MKAYEFIEHTADAAVRVYGRDLRFLFQNAAAAMFKLMAKPQSGILKSSSRKFKIELFAANQEELMIRWLSELLYLSESKKIILTEFEIGDLSSESLRAGVRGTSRQYFHLTTEIKAVTYHKLKIQKENNYYAVQIIFDV